MNKRLLAKLKPSARDASPLYLQLARKMAEAIRAGHYQAHEALPSERVLSEQLEVSRVTARNAIDLLVEQGLILRRRGSGNYIAPHLEQPLSRLTSFSEELRLRGYEPSSKWLKREVSRATAEEQARLGHTPGGKPIAVARLERLRLADGVGMAFEASVLPLDVLPDPAGLNGSLYEYLDRIGKAPVRAVQHIRAANCPARLAPLLGLPEGHAVLDITRTGFLATGAVIELTHSYSRSDYYDFVAEMSRLRPAA
ncbi:MAG: GntR family transcriptional regulator [Betaproteobacteria bacterium]|nr:GntR family transcriptional regulator [Betaproteobacteria bacterium]